jgi:hypothetical protein
MVRPHTQFRKHPFLRGRPNPLGGSHCGVAQPRTRDTAGGEMRNAQACLAAGEWETAFNYRGDRKGTCVDGPRSSEV